MQITKIGHCCLIIESKDVRIMTDPGNFSDAQNTEKDIDYILITHEHQDHLHVDSLKTVLALNPQAQIVTNHAVAPLLDKEGIAYTLMADGDVHDLAGVSVKAFEELHAVMHESFPRVPNTGFLFDDRFFYPGDAFINPHCELDALALPVAGPWLKLGEAIDYALELKPKVAFPVHDGMLKVKGSVHKMPADILGQQGIEFTVIEEGSSLDIS